MAITASLHIEDLAYMYVPHDEFAEPEGMARVYKLSEPVDLDLDGLPDEYVLVRLLWKREHMHAEIGLFPCDSTGALTGNDGVMRRMGSFPLVPDPKGNPDAIQYAIGVAFKFYDITVEAE